MRALRLCILTILLCRAGTAAEVSLVFRPRPNDTILAELAHAHGAGLYFYRIPITDRIPMENLVDPLGYGHVAIKFTHPLEAKPRVRGWAPRDAQTYEDFARLLSDVSGTRILKNEKFRGIFHDDAEWAEGAVLDPTLEIPLEATDSQVYDLVGQMQVMEETTWYQVQANHDKTTGQWFFPHNAANCLEAARRLLEITGIKVPFRIASDGQMRVFEKTARPYVTKKYFGWTCASKLSESQDDSAVAY